MPSSDLKLKKLDFVFFLFTNKMFCCHINWDNLRWAECLHFADSCRHVPVPIFFCQENTNSNFDKLYLTFVYKKAMTYFLSIVAQICTSLVTVTLFMDDSLVEVQISDYKLFFRINDKDLFMLLKLCCLKFN